MSAAKRIPVRFTFELATGETFAGFHDGSYWNGFPNLLVAPDEFRRLMRALREESDRDEERLGRRNVDEDEALDEMEELLDDLTDDGLVSIGWGYTPTIVE